MSYFSEMEWNTKWGWENLVAYGSKAMDSPKTNWMMVDEGEIGSVSFNLSAVGNNSVASGSDGGNGSSGKSSVSASTDSSAKQNPNFMFMEFDGSSLNLNEIVKMKGTEVFRNSPLLESSVGSVEPVIGLKLGKRTYFENNGNVRSTTLSVMPTPSTVMQKKTKSMCKNAGIPRCQVEGCNIDLSKAKEYHQKHRVCGVHAKSPKVIIGGQERRFCQQCSRFHNPTEFDERKRSCRKRLSDHNARRRKPAQETIQFNSPRLSAPFYGGRQQLTFLMNNSAYTHSIPPASSTWDNAYNSKFTLTKDYPLKSSNNGGTDEQLRMSGVKLSHLTMHGNSSNTLLSSKNFKPEVLIPGSKPVISSSHVDAAPAYRRALSLLSNNSWGSYAPDSIPLQHHPLHNIKDTSSVTHPTINAISEAVPFSCSDFWSTEQHLTHPRVNFQEIPLLETPYEGDLYSNIELKFGW